MKVLAKEQMEKAFQKSIQQLKSSHLTDYQNILTG